MCDNNEKLVKWGFIKVFVDVVSDVWVWGNSRKKTKS